MDHYQRSILHPNNHEFETATWALLCSNPDGLQQDGIEKVLNVTIEDYLFMGLWNVIHAQGQDNVSQVVGGESLSTAVMVVGDGRGSDLSHVGTKRFLDLMKSIKEWGPEYFQGGDG